MTVNDALSDVAGRLGLKLSKPAATHPEQAVEAPVEQVAKPARRPESVERFIGNDRVRTQLALHVTAAAARTEINRKKALAEGRDTWEVELPGHCLFCGPKGLGKTSLARIVAYETGGKLVEAISSAVNEPKNMARKLVSLSAGDVFFIDEIHSLSLRTAELLYSAMEDGKIEYIIGAGKSSEVVTRPVAPFVLVGATTMKGKVPAPMLDRFAFVADLEYYTNDQLAEIILDNALAQEVDIDLDACEDIARRSRGTPRIALNLFAKCRDYAQTYGVGIDAGVVDKTLGGVWDIDCLGLTITDQVVLLALCADLRGGPAGIGNLAATCGEDPTTVEYVVEPFLVRQGLMKRTPRGRCATEKAFRHIKMPVPADLGL